MYNLLPSRQLKVFISIVILISVFIIIVQPVSWLIKLSLLILLLFTGSFIRFERFQYYQLKKINNKQWILESPKGEIFEGRLQGDSLVCRWFCIIILKSKSQLATKKILIFPDMLSKKDYHHLKLQIKGYL